jgi:hypothetical protein
MLPVYWDNGGRGSGGEKFGLLDRQGGDPIHPKILEAMQRAAAHSYKLEEVAAPKPSK